MPHTSTSPKRLPDEQSSREPPLEDDPQAVETEEQPSVEQPDGLLSQIPSPTYLVLLAFLGVPGTLVASLGWMERFYYFGLFGFWPLFKGFLPSYGEDGSPTDWVTMGMGSQLWPLVSMVYLQLNPFVQAKGILQYAGHVPVLLRHRFRLPDAERFDQQVEYRLPVEGEWTVVSGGPTREHSHSWGLLAQRYAYDLVVTDDRGRTHEGDGDRPEEFYCYGNPVVAPADGVVVAVSDGHRDYHRTGGLLDPRQRDVRGNYITIRHANGEYSLLAHLQEGTLTVSKGDWVERGDHVARCGHSGNSTEPHLHFQLQDSPSFFRAMGLPLRFTDIQIREPTGESTIYDSAYVQAGQQVSSITSPSLNDPTNID